MAETQRRGGGSGSKTGEGGRAPRGQILGKQKKADLDPALFGEELHESLLYEAARADLAARRRGTASTLGRGEVSMTGAKAWRQKGTGRARAGALSSPTRRGGGVAFGPKPRHHTVKVNRKARRRALRAALSVHAERDTLAILEEGAFDEPATKRAAELLSKWGGRGPILVVLDAEETAAQKSFRNIPAIRVMPAGAVAVADLLAAASLVLSEPALEVLKARAGEVSRTPSRPAAPGSEAEEAGGNVVASGDDSGKSGEAAAAGSDVSPEAG